LKRREAILWKFKPLHEPIAAVAAHHLALRIKIGAKTSDSELASPAR
jgi:hypothetical protein